MKEQVMAVQKMQEYIESHLEEEITLADLAGESLFSPWHSYRLFRQYTNQTPVIRENTHVRRFPFLYLSLTESNLRNLKRRKSI